MPQHRNNRGQGAARVEENRRDDVNPPQHHAAVENRENRDPNLSYCSVPSGCERYYEQPINPNDPGDAVKVFCNNENCVVGQWMHKDCFNDWEQQVLSYLRSCGRARSWSEKQRLQNLWTKKGYDLAFKACDCKCGRGHLRKDLDYFAPAKPAGDGKKHKKNRKKNDKPVPVMSKGPQNHPARNTRPQLRVRTSSLTSTGSSPPNSASSSGTPPLTPCGTVKKSKFDFFADADQAAAGNIFKRRSDFSAFNILPRHQQNPYHIKMEDEGPHGNDEIRCFILSNLSTHQVTNVSCVTCNRELPVFDRYPLIDGTFFLSPLRYNSDLQVLSDGKMQYLNAVCMYCMEGRRETSNEICCTSCRRRWNGSTFVLGTMYSFDIFAAMPCCQQRLTCKSCHRQLLDASCLFQFYSEYSRSIRCPSCKHDDYHFVKPLAQCFFIKQPICN